MMTDPIADMLTRIRNANSIERPATDMKATKLKASIAQVLKDEGFILDYQVGKYDGTEFKDGSKPGEPGTVLRVYLKYGPEGEKVIDRIDRRVDRLPNLEGLGLLRGALETYRKIPVTFTPHEAPLPVAA